MSERRLYKACRVCRRQKMRCDGGSPCLRCVHSGATCIFDRSAGRRRANSAKVSSSGTLHDDSTRSPSSALEQQATSHVPLAQSFPSHTTKNSSRGGRNARHKPALAVSDDCEILCPTDLEVPVTAVHVLAHPAPHGEPQRNAAGWTPWNQSKWHRDEYTTAANVVDLGLISRDDAQRLFNNFMQSCNTALPFFDPVLDTFDTMRELSPFTLTVILLLAGRQESLGQSQNTYLNALQQDAKSRAADTLLQNPCSLDSVEAMLLLAAHSDKTWFGLGHAHQMALDLRLDVSMSRAMSSIESCTRLDSRCARLWLYMTFFERAIALGGARLPRCASFEHSELERFLAHKYSHPSDIFYCASLELFDMSVKVRLVGMPPSIAQVQTSLNRWSQEWNGHYDAQCVHESSLHRIRLRVQLLLAKTWQLAILLGRSLRPRQSSMRDEEAIVVIVEHIIHNDHELFAYIAQSEIYQQYFPWAPTYEVVLLSFSVIVGVKGLSMHRVKEQQSSFAYASDPIVKLLQKHPCQRYAQVVDNLLLKMSEWPQTIARPTSAGDTGSHTWPDLAWDLDNGLDGLLASWPGD